MRFESVNARTLLVVAAVISLLITAGPPAVEGARQVESQAVEQITIDGDPGDWAGISALHLDKSLPMVAVAHDDSYLYLMYRFDDQGLARQLSYHGLIFWLNGDGKAKNKHEVYGVRYGGSQQIDQHLKSGDDTAEKADSAAEKDRRDRTGRRPRHPRHRPRPGELTVIRMGIKKVVAEAAATGPAAASAVHDSLFFYELRIPLTDIGGKVAGMPAAKIRKLALGIQLGGLTEAERMIIEGQVEDDDMPGSTTTATTGAPSTMAGTSPVTGGFRTGHVPIQESSSFKAKIEWLKISLLPGAG